MAKVWLASAAAIAGMAIGGAQIQPISQLSNPGSSRAGSDAHETHAAASLLGQFRTSASSWLWLKTDLYLHNGVEMRLLTDAEQARGVRATTDRDGWHEAQGDEGRLATAIPAASRDFRGLFGDLERAVNAYAPMDGHVHNKPQTALPLFRLMTWLDPTFIPGWTTGAMVLSADGTRTAAERAEQLLLEGLEANPASVAIRNDLARIRIARLGRIRSALPVLEVATNLDAESYRKLSEDDAEAAIECFRWLAMAHKSLGATDASKAAAARGLRLAPDDPVLVRLANPAAALWTLETQESWFADLGVPVRLANDTQVKVPNAEPVACDGHGHAGHEH